MSDVLIESRLPYPRRQGKVRDVYDLGDALLIVASDRISAFDCVLPDGIPDKGRVLTRLSNWWFDRTRDVIENHVIATNLNDFPRPLRSFGDQLIGRSILAKKTRVVPIECVARGYLAGSCWKEYQKSGTVCGQRLPRGLTQSAKLPEAIFTPATKAETGHDENVSFEVVAKQLGTSLAGKLRETTLSLYNKAAAIAAERGILLADTKFEFGELPDGRLILIDEILTPDSSRFWSAADYAPGRDQASFDKQFVRNFLEGSTWDKTPPAPPLPAEVIEGTRRRYIEAYERITGLEW